MDAENETGPIGITLPKAIAAGGWRLQRILQEDARFNVCVVEHPGRGETGLLKQRVSTADHVRRGIAIEISALNGARFDPPVRLPALFEAADDYYLVAYCQGTRLAPNDRVSPEQTDLLAASLNSLRRGSLPNDIPALSGRPRRALRNLLIKTFPGLAPDVLSRAEALTAIRRGMSLLAHVDHDPVPSHGDFTLTNIFFERDAVVVTDLESLCRDRNAFYDPAYLTSHALIGYDDWAWQAEVMGRVCTERLQEAKNLPRAKLELESALFFAAVLRLHDACVQDAVLRAPSRIVPAWLRPRRGLAPSSKLRLRIENLRRVLDPAGARALIKRLTA